MIYIYKVGVLIASLLVLAKIIIDAHEYCRIVTLAEVYLCCLNLVNTWDVHLGTKLTNDNIRIVDLSTDNLAVTVDTCHNVVGGVHVCT